VNVRGGINLSSKTCSHNKQFFKTTCVTKVVQTCADYVERN
jgi:hypothetical protein